MSTSVVPIPKCDATVRPATLADVPFIDSLQKQSSDALGFMPDSWIEAKIGKEKVLIAESNGSPIGYVMGTDRYQKHDDVGIVYQLNVAASHQRSFVGLTLLKGLFDASAYGCKLYCCWCAQDLAANKFWEAMGFVPLAYRAGSEKKRRVHIFWQKRIREGDTTTPWWFPCATSAGAMSADRIVLPIPDGTHWSDEMPVIVLPVEQKAISNCNSEISNRKLPPPKPAPIATSTRRLSFVATAPIEAPKLEKMPRQKKPKRKNDPKLAAMAREFRDRRLEQINDGRLLIESFGKYDVSRILPSSPAPKLPHSKTKLLSAA